MPDELLEGVSFGAGESQCKPRKISMVDNQEEHPSGETHPSGDDKKTQSAKPMLERFRRIFLAGLLVTVPVFVCVYAVYLIMTIADRVFGKGVEQVIGMYYSGMPEDGAISLVVRGSLSFILAVIAISFIGWLSTFILIRKFISIGESIVNRHPLVKFFYNTPKEVINTLTMPRKGAAKRVVMIEYPRRGMWCLAFATGEVTRKPDGTHLVAVFLPTTPNPTSGFLLYIPASDVLDTNIPVEQGARMIISGGILGPEYLYTQKFSGLEAAPKLPPLEPLTIEESAEVQTTTSSR
ncbi:MAG: DUF502 domain-containing protein [Candidatus Sumerlaeia bacterium]|nr:DUF502 domain-containing protein [Candidatus Sumerlaeia bacterium]